VKNLDFALGFADLIVDEKRAVQQLANQGSFSNRAAHMGKPSQQFNVGGQGTAKAGGSLRVVLSNMADDFSEIV